MLFDTHAHMDDRAFDIDREELLSRVLPNAQIGLLMNPGCSLASSRAASRLSREYPYVYAAVGSHPDAADEVDEAVLDAYRALCRENPKIKAIGGIMNRPLFMYHPPFTAYQLSGMICTPNNVPEPINSRKNAITISTNP